MKEKKGERGFKGEKERLVVKKKGGGLNGRTGRRNGGGENRTLT